MDARTLNEKLSLIKWLSSIEDESIVKKLLEFRKKVSKDWWEQVSEKERESIQKGIKQADTKDLEPHTEVQKIYEKWL